MTDIEDFEHEIIAMAWSDDVSFTDIKRLTGYAEKDVIHLMKKKLKKRSYVLWRKRVKGRLSKSGLKGRLS